MAEMAVMAHRSLYVLFIVIYLCAANANAADDCPCTLLDSDRYPGSTKWDCVSLGLQEVPGQCFSIVSNVTEVYLTDNTIVEIRNIDFAGLSDLRALYIDYNDIDFFDPTALAGISQLEYFHGEQNKNMELPPVVLLGKKELVEVILYGSGIQTMPNITDAVTLKKLDVRSCELVSLPRPMLYSKLITDTFIMSMSGNSFVDVAADILLPLPAGATINVDSYVTIWAMDQAEKETFLAKQFSISIDLDINLRVCNVDGSPTDALMC